MLVSLIVPAHDEARLIGRTVQRLRDAADGAGLEYEIVVADDASGDQTGHLAGLAGARVVRHERRQIAATRNLGASAAIGDTLIFVDADTWPNSTALRQAVEAIRAGAVGGGASMVFDGRVPLYARVITPLVNLAFRLKGRSGGAFFFCTRAALAAAGGWDESVFAAEEIYLAIALKKQGRFVVIKERVLTSGRKLRSHGFGELARVLLAAVRNPDLLKSREALGVWYGPRRRDDPEHHPD
ncbi:MAG: glycosyltransferase [Phycisphaerales bacterium]|nr:glycosyltransferase [Phycisphaerales bacterium]